MYVSKSSSRIPLFSFMRLAKSNLGALFLAAYLTFTATTIYFSLVCGKTSLCIYTFILPALPWFLLVGDGSIKNQAVAIILTAVIALVSICLNALIIYVVGTRIEKLLIGKIAFTRSKFLTLLLLVLLASFLASFYIIARANKFNML
jgi:hypothetical protein